MKKLLFLTILLMNFNLWARGSAEIKDLLNVPSLWNNKEVEVKGEVLDVLKAKGGSWINLLEGGLSLGVWVPQEVKIPPLEYFAGYHQKGDLIKVKGKFYFNSPKHLGQSIIEAQEIFLIEKGGKIAQKVLPQRRRLFLFWAILFITTGIIYLLKNIKNARRISKA